MALYKQIKDGKEGRFWWYEFAVNGQRIRESTGETTRTKALAKERERHNELSGGGRAARLDKLRRKLFPDAAKEWRAANVAGWSESYTTIQDKNIEYLTAYFGKRMALDIGADDFGKYRAHQRKTRTGKGLDEHGNPNTVSQRTITIELSTLRMILKSLKLWRAIEDDVKMPTDKKPVGKALEQEEVGRLFDACRKSPQPSLYTAVIVFCCTALRNAELRKARWRQVDFKRAEFTVGKAKTDGSTGRVVPLSKQALDALQAWKKGWPEAGADDFIFPSQKLKYVGKGTWLARGKMNPYDTDLTKPLGSWKKSWATAQKAAGVKARIHDCRHHALSVLAESGAPDVVIKAVGGHVTDEAMEIYRHARDDAKRKWTDALGESYTGMIQ